MESLGRLMELRQGLLIVVYSGASIPVILSGARNLTHVKNIFPCAQGDN